MKKLLTLLLLAVGFSTGAWALEQDGEGYYLIGSAQDWQDFAALVQTTPTANAKMTADIDLGNDQTKIGDFDVAYAYGGIFDGQGHTLNVNYYSTSSIVAEGYAIAPFRNIKGATIKNLTVTGSITGYRHPAGVVGYTVSPSTNLISNVTVSATINIVESYGGGFIGHCETSTTTIQDCLFNGTINGKAGGSVVGVFFANSNGASMSLTNCLENGSYTNCSTFSPTSCPTDGTTAVTNCHYTVSGSYSGTHASATELADGTTAYKLQNNRADLVWGQRIGTDAKPVLTGDESYRVYMSKNGGYTNNPEDAYEGLQQDGEGYYLLGGLTDWQDFATLVETTPTANAKMTADINLGDDQTMVGTISVPYQGSFDGQGHTLTVNYDMTTYDTAVAPFACVGDATIQNLHVDGSIIQRRCGAGGVAGTIKGNLTVSQCWVSAYMYVQGSGNLQGTIGGIASYCDDPNVRNCKIVIEDCLFSGHLGSGYHCGGLMSHVHGSDGYNNSAQFNNCLNLGTCNGIAGSTGTFIRTGIQGDPYTITNCYYKTAWKAVQGTQATNEQLANGTTAAALQNNRAETIWVQDPVTNQPMLALFAGKYKVPTSGLGTFSAKAAFTLPEGLEAYYCKDYDATEGTIGVTAINGVVPAETGVLLRGEPGETYTLTTSDETAATVTDNALVAVTEQTTIQQTEDINEVSYTNFGLSGGVFKKVNTNGGTVKANRAYLRIPTSALTPEASARGILLAWDGEPTGVGNLDADGNLNLNDNLNLNCYDLQGRRVVNPARGLYIVNGKKVVIK